MRALLGVHILAGGVGLVTGFIALYAGKGARLHRRMGIVFVGAMVVLGLTGAAIAAIGGGVVSVIAGLLAAYLVVTAMMTVRPRTPGARKGEIAAVAVATLLCAGSMALGFDALANGGSREGVPAVVLFKFGVVALLGTIGDFRVIRSGALSGAPRLARHLWRMCFALYLAAASFFFGQADTLPAALRIPALLAVPVIAVIVTMFWWLWRLRRRRHALREIVIVAAPERAWPVPISVGRSTP